MTAPIKITHLKAEIWSAARSWIFWLIMSISMLGLVGQYLRLEFLSIPFVCLVIGILPLVGSHYAPRFGIFYLNARILYDKLWPTHLPRKISYYFSEQYLEPEPRLREPVFHTMISVFGIIYTIYTVLAYFAPYLTDPGSRFLLIAGLMLPCLIFSSVISTSAWLFRLLGFTYENRVEGDRLNLGKDMRSRLSRVIGIPAAISFGYMFFKSPADFGEGISTILLIITFCTPSTLFSFYIFNKRYLERMKKEFRTKLLKFTNDSSTSPISGT